MGKFLTFILGFAVLGYAAYRYLYGAARHDELPTSAPKATMDRMHEKAGDLERQMQQRADEAGAEPAAQ